MQLAGKYSEYTQKLCNLLKYAVCLAAIASIIHTLCMLPTIILFPIYIAASRFQNFIDI